MFRHDPALQPHHQGIRPMDKALAQQLLDGFGKTLTVGALALDEYTSSCVLDL